MIKEFGSLENLYKELKEETERTKLIKGRLKETLLCSKEQAFFSRELTTIQKNVPIDFNLKECQWGDYNKEATIQLLKNLDFKSLIARLP